MSIEHSPGSQWLSAHIYHEGGWVDGADNVLAQVVEPYIRELQSRDAVSEWFFVRYWDYGTHVRLRAKLTAASQSFGEMALIEAARQYMPASLLLSAPSIIPKARVSPHEALLWVPYEPEFDRYGGTFAMELCQELFTASSELTIALLPGIVSKELDRAAMALGATVLFLAVMVGDRSEASFLARGYQAAFDDVEGENAMLLDAAFESIYLPQAQSLQEQVENWWSVSCQSLLPDEFANYAERIGRARERLGQLVETGRVRTHDGRAAVGIEAAIRTIGLSVMHMANNRMGLTRRNEAFLGHVVRQALQS